MSLTFFLFSSVVDSQTFSFMDVLKMFDYFEETLPLNFYFYFKVMNGGGAAERKGNCGCCFLSSILCKMDIRDPTPVQGVGNKYC